MIGLEYLAKQTGISYEKLSENLGVSVQTLYKWIEKVEPIPPHHLEILSKTFTVEEEIIEKDLSPSIMREMESERLRNIMKQSLSIFEMPKQTVNIAFQPTSDPVAKQNFERTIKQPVPLLSVQGILRKNELEEIGKLYNGMDFRVWGVRNGEKDTTKKQYEKLKVGDIVLFYKNWNIYSKAIVTYKTCNPDLAQTLWGEAAFENIYFLTEIEPCLIPVELVNQIIYDKAKQFPIRRFEVLALDKSELLINKLRLKVEPHLKSTSREEYEKAIKLNIREPLNKMVNSVNRVEQGYLRKYLFGKSLYAKCACCGNTYPISQLVTAHIKKRSHCSLEEMLDTHVVMPMCKFGCDSLYEDGYISVNDNGKYIRLDRSMKKVTTSSMEDLLEKLDGRQCLYWNSNTEHFFHWHREYHSLL